MAKPSKIYRLLEFPQLYSLIQKILVPEAELLLKRKFRHIFDKSRSLVLDLGCGPASPLQLPDATVVGVDSNPLYVRKYVSIKRKNRFFCIGKCNGQQNRLGCVCSAIALPFRDNAFDETRCLGVFHHLDKNSVLSAIKEMIRCTGPRGRIILFDSVWPRVPFYRPLAWLLCYFDRGKWMLREEELLELVNTAYPKRWQGRRFTYTFTGLEGLFLTAQKAPNE